MKFDRNQLIEQLKQQSPLIAKDGVEISIGRISGVMRVTREKLLEAFNMPEDAKVIINIPRGGDYSGQPLEVDDLFIRWEDK